MRKLEHIIFDMGNVLLDFQPGDYARFYTDGDEDAALLEQALFGNPEWLRWDAGLVAADTVAEAACGLLPRRLHAAARAAVTGWESLITPIGEMCDLVRDLKAAGCGVYILSNTSTDFHTFGPARIPVFPLLDGCVISADEHLMKPDPALFQVLFDRYHLDPETCFFVDDRAENCQTAAALGMGWYQYRMDTAALRQALGQAGGLL